jgi:hypothetical protein
MALEKVFGDRIISCGLWPASSPDLTPCDLFMGNLKDKIKRAKPKTEKELKEKHMRKILNLLRKNSFR